MKVYSMCIQLLYMCIVTHIEYVHVHVHYFPIDNIFLFVGLLLPICILVLCSASLSDVVVM